MISVVVPVYNVEKYLRECVDSILNQTYKNFEIILVDDGSTDSSGSICEQYADQYDNIYVIHKENAGLGMARNTGIEVAKGDYITFIDSDDYIDENSFELLINEIKKNDADVCLGGFKKVDDDKHILFVNTYPYQILGHNGVSNEVLTKMFGSSPGEHDSITMSVCNVLFRLNIIKDNELRFKSEREYISEDMIFDVDFYRYAKKCVILDMASYNYRFNTNSLTTTYKPERFSMVKKYTDYLLSLLETHGFSEECKYRAIKQFFINLRVCFEHEHLKTNPKSAKDSIKTINCICKDPFVQDVIKMYPVHELKIKQKLFVYLIKLKLSSIIYYMCK